MCFDPSQGETVMRFCPPAEELPPQKEHAMQCCSHSAVPQYEQEELQPRVLVAEWVPRRMHDLPTTWREQPPESPVHPEVTNPSALCPRSPLTQHEQE